MRNLMIAFIATVMCVTAAWAQDVDLYSTPQENPKPQFERFNKMKKVGTGLIIGGAVSGTAGMVIALSGVDAAVYDDEWGLYLTGLLIEYVGFTTMAAGIPLRIVGRVKERQYRGQTALYLAPNGVKLAVNF
jgi:hypothetical protein